MPDFTKSRQKGTYEGVMSDISTLTIDADSTYSILDYPIGGITNAQMAAALTEAQAGFYQVGSVYMCTDTGTYHKDSFYKFTGIEWEEVEVGSDIEETTLTKNISDVFTAAQISAITALIGAPQNASSNLFEALDVSKKISANEIEGKYFIKLLMPNDSFLMLRKVIVNGNTVVFSATYNVSSSSSNTTTILINLTGTDGGIGYVDITASKFSDILSIPGKQEELVSGTNIKTVNGSSLLGAGNMSITTYQAFPASWTTDSTIAALMNDIENDSSATVGMSYLGEVTCSDLPFSGNAELIVSVMNGSGANKVLLAHLTSGNVRPYYWQYTYWNGQGTGWKSFISTESIDTVVTQGSSNVITSGAVYNALKGKVDPVSFSNYQTMITAFNAASSTDYNVGQDVFIVTTGIPDLWVSSIEATSVTYTYVDDQTFIDSLLANGYVQVGYYKLSYLEDDLQIVETIYRDAVTYYNITTTLTNCSGSNQAMKVVENGAYVSTITPNTGYTMRDIQVTVIMGSTDITSTVYDDGVISIAQVTDDLTITVVCRAIIYYTITNTLTNCYTTEPAITTIPEFTRYRANILPNIDSSMDSLTVTMGGTDITSTVVDGVAIDVNQVTGNIVITGVASVSTIAVYNAAQTGVTYITLENLDNATDAQITTLSKAISNNSSIDSTTTSIYLSNGLKIDAGATRNITYDDGTYTATLEMVIIGFNHDTLTSSTAYGEVTTTGKAGISWMQTNYSSAGYLVGRMNSTNTNVGGWASSELRTTYLPLIEAALPTSVVNSMKNVNKLTSAGNQSTTIDTTSDKLFFVSEVEYLGYTNNSATGEGTQYAYVPYLQNYFWTRSPNKNNAISFIRVYYNYSMINNASSSNYLAICYCT